MEIKKFTMTYWPIEKLVQYPNNCKVHPETQIEKIAQSIKSFGFDQPISVDTQGIIIKGHGRLMASKLLGLKEVPVIVRDDLTLIEAKASRIADNKVAESAWDQYLLPIELKEIDNAGFDLSTTGFEMEEINTIFGNDDFEPENNDESQRKLDKKKPIICPNCQHEFIKS